LLNVLTPLRGYLESVVVHRCVQGVSATPPGRVATGGTKCGFPTCQRYAVRERGVNLRVQWGLHLDDRGARSAHGRRVERDTP
jgi:hypothetical protein